MYDLYNFFGILILHHCSNGLREREGKVPPLQGETLFKRFHLSDRFVVNLRHTLKPRPSCECGMWYGVLPFGNGGQRAATQTTYTLRSGLSPASPPVILPGLL